MVAISKSELVEWIPSGKQMYVNWLSIAVSLSSFENEDVGEDVLGMSCVNRLWLLRRICSLDGKVVSITEPFLWWNETNAKNNI